MIYTLFSIIILIPTLIGIGSLVQKIIPLWKGISAKIILGILFTTIVWTVVAFYIPLNLCVEIPTVIFGLVLFLVNKNLSDLNSFFFLNKKLLIPILGVILLFSSYYPFILDHFGYYVPSIQWLTHYGLIKGISNIDLVLGQMSFWHILQAGFSNFTDPFLRINALILIVYLIYILEKKAYQHFYLFPILFLFIQSPSPDLPVLVFGLMILNEVFLMNKNTSGLFVLSIFIFTIKPTLLWAPLFIFLNNLVKHKNIRWFIPGIALFALFIFKNFITFGFPLFPLPLGDLGLDWKPAPQLLERSSQIAIMKTYDMQYSYNQIKNFTIQDYLVNWLSLKGMKSFINFLFSEVLLILGIYITRQKKKVLTILFFSILIKSVLVLLFSAQYRFFIDVFFVAFIVLVPKTISSKWSLFSFTFFSLILFIGFSYPKIFQKSIPSFRMGYFMRGFHLKQIVLPSVYQLEKFDTYQIGNMEFNIVTDYPFLFDTPPPALTQFNLKQYHHFGIFPKKRGFEIKDGFHWKKLNFKEKKQLDALLQNLQNQRNHSMEDEKH